MAEGYRRGGSSSDQVSMGKGHQLAVPVLGELEKKKEKKRK